METPSGVSAASLHLIMGPLAAKWLACMPLASLQTTCLESPDKWRPL